jgi:membrane protein DedA with SNARE-associated domain
VSRSPVVEVVAALLAGGLGLPIPEELALVTAGWLIARGEPAAPMCLAALSAVLAGDLTMYVAGRSARLGFVRRVVGASRLERLERACARYGAKLLLVARFVPGLRAGLLVATGAGRVSLSRFIACDGVAALVGVALWITVGHRLGPRLDGARALIANARGGALVLVALAAAAFIIAKRVRAARPRFGAVRRLQSDVRASDDGSVQSR